MVQELFNQNIFIYIMAALCACGILFKLILNMVFSRLVKASDSMATSKNKLTRTMKKKFETCYKLKIGVNNVDIFVDKYVFHHRFCGILLSTWENIGGQILMLCLLTGSISSILGLIYECGKTQILSTFSVGIVSSGLLIFLEGMFNLAGKKDLIRLNMKDYLENSLKIRLEQEIEQPDLIEQYKTQYLKQSDTLTTGSAGYVAASVEPVRSGKKSKKDKPAGARLNKRTLKQQKKDDARAKKETLKAEVKEEKARIKEEKILMKENKKKEKLHKKQEAREAKENMKIEAKMALERKREAERAEIERIRAEVKAQEERKKEEKRRQEEIKKALLLEKQANKESKKKQQPAEQKTIAQEKKEILLKEIKERRSMEGNEEETTSSNQDVIAEQIAVTVVQDKPLTYNSANSNKVESKVDSKEEDKKVMSQKIEYNKEDKAEENTKTQENKTIISKESNVASRTESKQKQADEVLIKDNQKEDMITFEANEVKSRTNQTRALRTNQSKSNNKTKKVSDSLDDKLIEDILKEFLA